MDLIKKIKRAYVRYRIHARDSIAISKFETYCSIQHMKKSIELMLHPNDEDVSVYTEIDYSKCPLKAMRSQYRTDSLKKRYT